MKSKILAAIFATGTLLMAGASSAAVFYVEYSCELEITRLRRG